MPLCRFLTLFALTAAAMVPVCQTWLPEGVPFVAPALSLALTLAAVVEGLLGESFSK